MTSVNSPASLLARNHFYRSLSQSSELIKPTSVISQNDFVMQKPREVTFWFTMATPPELPVVMETKGLSINIDLGSKPTNPADRRDK